MIMWRILVLLVLLLPQLTFGSNAGIVRGLWYDQENIFAGQSVRIYVAVRNNTGGDLSGTVEFFVNDSRIERNNISALDGRIVESWADWTPSYGTSTITATLSRTELTTTASGTKAVAVISALAEDTFFVDYDTDRDNLGDSEDTDDDNDGVSDAAEKAAGTDPKKYDKKKEATADENEEKGDNEDGGEAAVLADQEPAGLEQFLTPSRADSILTNVTDLVKDTKEKIDTYREKRNENIAIKKGEVVPDIAVNDDGFGEIERISREDKSKPIAEKPDLKDLGFFGDLLTFLGNIISGVYTLVLFTFSWFLGHPMLVQLLLLFMILFGLFYTAKRLSRRPN